MRKVLGAVTLGAVLTVSACGGDKDAAETTTTAAAVETTAPAETTTVPETTEAPTTVPETTMPEPSTTAATGLALGLLTQEDVGSAWKRSNDLSVEDLSSIGDEPCLGATVDAKIVERLKSTVGVQYEPAEGELSGMQQLALEGDAAQLTADLDVLFKAIGSCLDKDITAPEGEKVRYTAMSLPAGIADQVMGIAVVANEPPDFQRTWRGFSAVARVDGKVFLLNAFEILPTPETAATITAEAFTTVLQNAVARMRTAP